MTKQTKWPMHPVKTQISLGICPVWSESSLCTQWIAQDPKFLHADSEDSDQTGQMPRLIWVFTGCICVDAQDDPSLCLVHVICWFCCAQAHMVLFTVIKEIGQYEPCHEKTVCDMLRTKMQMSLCGLISNFVISCLDSIMPLVSISKISRLKLVSVAAQASLSLTWSQTPKTGFLVTRLI